MDFIGLILFFVALSLVSRLFNSVRSSSPAERYFKAFNVSLDAKPEDTERAFQRVFIREKQPYAAFCRQLLHYDGRELTKEDKEQIAKLRKDMTKVLKNLKDLFDLAFLFKPGEAKKVAEDLHIDQLIALLAIADPMVATVTG